jgi:hypothetical protein
VSRDRPAASQYSTPSQVCKEDIVTADTTTGRKPWVKKSPLEVFLDQIKKQADRVAEMRKELQKEEQELQKLEAARKVLEGK